MNANVGEQIVASYLKYIKECDFTQTNTYTIDTQGEIDVIGIHLASKTVYVCEVAIHLVTGLQYTKNGKNSNFEKITQKFQKDIQYISKYFDDYTKVFMFWSPVIRNSRGKEENNQLNQVKLAHEWIKSNHGIDVEIIANSVFREKMDEMREFASKSTVDISCPILRTMQIEEYIKRNEKRVSQD
jgi:hypothetical protein